MNWYPHKLCIREDNIGINNSGEFSSFEENYTLLSDCRQQVNSSGKIITGTSGDSITFNSLIHLPLTTEIIPVGTFVRIYTNETKQHLRVEGFVLRFSKDLMHCRLWL